MKLDLPFIANKYLLEYDPNVPHAIVKFEFPKDKYPSALIEEIAVGQTVGHWSETHVSLDDLLSKVAKIISYEESQTHHIFELSFPAKSWYGNLAWLLTLLYGKMSFFSELYLRSLGFSKNCFADGLLVGPQLGMSKLRACVGVTQKNPLLMAILKPNVSMSPRKIAELYETVAMAGCHLVKDDEIRFDADRQTVLDRVAAVAQVKQKNNFKTIYAVHLQWATDVSKQTIVDLESAGADAFLLNVWTAGLDALQALRKMTNKPILAHPALAGAISGICPSVLMGSLIRAAGADMSLFPSPYGTIGLPKNVTLEISAACQTTAMACEATIPVPSAGIKPLHAAVARHDFGPDHVLNAGTGIFAGDPGQQVQQFLSGLNSDPQPGPKASS